MSKHLRQLTSDLQQVSHSLVSAAYGQAGAAAAAGAGAGAGAGGTSGSSGADDDVIDAEYTPK